MLSIAETHESPRPGDTPERLYVGRQPIFDRGLEIFAYELLYRGPAVAMRPGDGDRASALILLDALLELGLEKVAGGRPVFVNATRAFLAEIPKLPAVTGRFVWEILEHCEVDEALLGDVQVLGGQGHSLALDDYTFDPRWDPVLPLVDIVKVDLRGADRRRIERGMDGLRRGPQKLLAEKVETPEEYRWARDLGFDYFQGFFFARPDVVSGERLGESHAIVLRLLSRLNDPEADIEEIEGLIRQDPRISVKLLRFINSVAVGLRRRVESIREAVVFVGLARIRSWANLVIMGRLTHKPKELITLALVRANLCERLVLETRQGSEDTAYTVGLLSILDALLDAPLADVLSELPLGDAVTNALSNHEGTYGQALACSKELENGRLMASRCPGVDAATVNRLYLDSIEKADQMIRELL
jgi:EAL and modified HD-GYP domain-containing signal transduction protein